MSAPVEGMTVFADLDEAQALRVWRYLRYLGLSCHVALTCESLLVAFGAEAREMVLEAYPVLGLTLPTKATTFTPDPVLAQALAREGTAALA